MDHVCRIHRLEAGDVKVPGAVKEGGLLFASICRYQEVGNAG